MRVAIASTFLVATIASEAGAATAARLVYTRAPDASSCPDEEALRKAVASRVGYDPFVAIARTTVVAEIARSNGVYVGHVLLIDDRGVTRGRRDLSSNAASCETIFETVALAISIAIDAEEAPEAPAPSAPSPASPPAPAPTPAPVPEPAPALAPSPSPPNDFRPARTPSTAIALSLYALFALGIAPAPGPGAALGLQVRRDQLSLGVDGRALLPSSSDTTGASLVAGGAFGCFHVDPAQFCAVAVVGSFEAKGVSIASPRSASALFAATGARVLFTLSIARSVALRFGAEGLANLHRATLLIDGTDVWTAPPVAATLFGGIALRFP
jgi:hypothetical protein